MADTEYPIWLDDFRYLDRWKGEIVEVDIRRLKPVRVSEALIREASGDAGRLMRRSLTSLRLVK